MPCGWRQILINEGAGEAEIEWRLAYLERLCADIPIPITTAITAFGVDVLADFGHSKFQKRQ